MNQQEIIAALKSGSYDWKNFGGNRFGNNALGYDADFLNFMNYMGPRLKLPTAMGFNGSRGYDADFRNYSGGMMTNQDFASMDAKQRRKYLDSQVASGAMTAFRFKIVYIPGLGVPADVNITMFQMAFNSGTFNSAGDLEFTNAGGDTARISGLTKGQNGLPISIRTLFNLTETEPFTLGFLRIKPKTQGQLDQAMGILKDSQWGGFGGNSITPDDYIDPDQFQLLRVDVPMNVDCSKKEGFNWTITPDQTGDGVSATMFIPKTLDPGRQLKGDAPVRVLNDGIPTPFNTPTQPTNQLKAIASNDQVKAIMSSSVSPEMGAAMINSILPGMLNMSS